ncbi:unnamed protein product [Effrenium voratum]|nr:unnamed protein product [Effrenium voratum]
MEYSLQGLKSEYDNMVRASQQRAAEAQMLQEPKSDMAPLPEDERVLSLEEALHEVAEDGLANWVLLDPARLNVYKTGSGGFDQMKEHLAADRVLFGLVRLSFGGSMSRMGCSYHGLTKHVLVHWVGPTVSAVRRGLWGAKCGEVAALVARYCAVAFRQEANSFSDLKLEEIISKLQRLTVVDSMSCDSIAARISLEEYNMARAEEMQRQQKPKPREVPKEKPREPKVLPDLQTAVRMVRDPRGHIDWVLCGLSSPRLPPTPCRSFARAGMVE